MNNQHIKSLLSEHLNKPNFDVDLTGNIMLKINEKPRNRNSSKKIILIAALLVLLTSVAYAAIVTIIDLKNNSGSTDLQINIVDSPTPMIEKSVFVDFDYEDIPVELRERPALTLYIEDPTQFIHHHGSYYIDDYDDLLNTTDMTYDLPNSIESYIFSRALVGYMTIMPTQEELNEIAKMHPEEKFFTFELDYSHVVVDHYEYSSNGLCYTIQPTASITERYYHEDNLVNYEVINLSTTEAFVMERDNIDFTVDQSGNKIEREYTNNYQIFWKDGDYEYLIRPSRSNVEYPDFKDRTKGRFPEQTKNDLIELATFINAYINK